MGIHSRGRCFSPSRCREWRRLFPRTGGEPLGVGYFLPAPDAPDAKMVAPAFQLRIGPQHTLAYHTSRGERRVVSGNTARRVAAGDQRRNGPIDLEDAIG